MRRVITISVSDELHEYMIAESRYTSVSEYVRSLVIRDRERRTENAERRVPGIMRANEVSLVVEAREHLEKLRMVLEQGDLYSD